MKNIKQGDKIQMMSNEKVARTFIILEIERIGEITNARLFDTEDKTEQWMAIYTHYNISWKIIERLTPLNEQEQR